MSCFTSEEAKELVATTRATLQAEAEHEAINAASLVAEGTAQEEGSSNNDHVNQVTFVANQILQNIYFNALKYATFLNCRNSMIQMLVSQ